MLAFWTHFTPEQKALALSAGSLVLITGCAQTLPLIQKWIPKGRLGKKRSQAAIRLGRLNLTDDARMRHTHIVGATGSGKTVLIEHLLYRDLARGYGALIIDPKGEREFYERVRAYCEKIGRAQDLHLLSATYPDESARWNPCRLGTESELQSKFFCASKYEHSFYAKACELALLEAFEGLGKRGKNPLTLDDLVQELDRLSQSGKDENLKGLYFDIQNLARGEWSGILGTAPKVGNLREVSLLDITRKNEILFVDLPTEGKSVQSARLGALLLQEITLLSGIRKRIPEVRSALPFSVYIDEFDAFATDPFVTFLNKGRSSGFMIHMAHQTLSDLSKVSPTFQGQIMGNPNIRFIFRVDVAEDAEKIAKQFGTRSVIKRTFQTQDGQETGRGSGREVQEFKIHPDSIKELQTGECVVSIKTDGFLVQTRIPKLEDRNLPAPKVPIHRRELPTATVQTSAIQEVVDSYSALLAPSKPKRSKE